MTQCMGTTQKGDRCRRNAVDGSDYCNAHQFQAGTDPGWTEGGRAESAGNGGNGGGASNGGSSGGQAKSEWTWSECLNFENETTRWAAIGFAMVGLMFLFRRR